jgi:hypothetical protein
MRRVLPFLLAALPLCAQDATLGVRAQAVVPMGDLRDLTDGQVGLGAGVFVEIPIGDSLRLRPTLGGQYFPKKTSASLGGAEVTVSSVDFMLDALWFPGETADQGPYLVGGAGGQMWRVSPTGAAATSHTRLGLSGGIGYQFTPHLGFEARAFWSPVEPNLTATGLSLGGVVRF